MDENNKLNGNGDNGNNDNGSNEPAKTVEYVSTGFAVKSVWHNGKEGAKKVVAKAKPVGKKILKGVFATVVVLGGVKLISELKDGKEPKLDGADEVEGIDTVIQWDENGNIVATPEVEIGETSNEETTEE